MCALDVFWAFVQVNGSRIQSSLCFASMWAHCVEVLWGGDCRQRRGGGDE